MGTKRLRKYETVYADTYTDRAGKWRWRMRLCPDTHKARRAFVIAKAVKGYATREECEDVLSKVVRCKF